MEFLKNKKLATWLLIIGGAAHALPTWTSGLTGIGLIGSITIQSLIGWSSIIIGVMALKQN